MSTPETNLLGYIEQINTASINSGSGHVFKPKDLKDSEESKESNKGPSCVKASNSKPKTAKSDDFNYQMIIREISENDNIKIEESVEEEPLDYNNKRIKAYEVFDLILKTPFPSLFQIENEEIYEFECFPKKELKIEDKS